MPLRHPFPRERAQTLKRQSKSAVLRLFPGKLFKIRFDFANLVGDNAFKVTQIVEDLTFEIDFSAVALTDLIEFIDHIAQIRADFLNFFVSLSYTVSDDGLTLAWIFKLHALGEKLSFVLVTIDFQNVVISFLAKAVTINFIRIGNAQTFQIIVHSGTLDLNITFE